MRLPAPRRHAWLVAVLLLLTCLPGGCGFAAAKVHVALLVRESTDQHGKDLLEGARTAAGKYGLSSREYGYKDTSELAALIAQAEEEGADAMVLELDPVLSGAFGLPETTLPVITIGGELQSPQTVASILNRDDSMGENMGREVLRRVGLQTHVALIADTPLFSVRDEREAKLRDNLGYCGTTLVARVNGENNIDVSYRSALRILSGHPEVRVILTFGAQGTLGAAKAVTETGRDVQIIGTDVTEGTVEALETGAIDALFVRRSFAMGYRGMESVARVLVGEPVVERFYLDAVLVDRENLYTPDMETLLFPMDAQ